jgi:hypothetical protein
MIPHVRQRDHIKHAWRGRRMRLSINAERCDDRSGCHGGGPKAVAVRQTPDDAARPARLAVGADTDHRRRMTEGRQGLACAVAGRHEFTPTLLHRLGDHRFLPRKHWCARIIAERLGDCDAGW